jgi:UDP-glucose 4-epimerase
MTQSKTSHKKKAVVTGGAGFIGSHIVEELIQQGYYVVILDDLSTGKLGNIEALLKDSDAKFVQGSVTKLSLLRRAFQGAQYVFHQAAIPSVPRSVAKPLASHEANVTGTLKVLITARECGVGKVIYASSSSVYGDTPTLPKHEGMTPHPQSPYALTKCAGEHYCQIFEDIYGLPTASLRYFNVYGPRQDPESEYAAVIPKFAKRVRDSERPIIFGDGEQTRDFTFVKDVVQANLLAAESDATGVFNIGRGASTSLNELANLITSIMGKDLNTIYQESRPGDVKHSLADISRARELLGYHPKHSLRDGLELTIANS